MSKSVLRHHGFPSSAMIVDDKNRSNKREEFRQYLKTRRKDEINRIADRVMKQRQYRNKPNSPDTRYWTDIIYESKFNHTSFKEKFFLVDDEIPVSPRYFRRKSQVMTYDWKMMLTSSVADESKQEQLVDCVIVAGPSMEEVLHSIDAFVTNRSALVSNPKFLMKLEPQVLFLHNSSEHVPEFSCIEDFFFPVGVTVAISHELVHPYADIEPGRWIPCDNNNAQTPSRFVFSLVGNYEIFGDCQFHVTSCTRSLKFMYKTIDNNNVVNICIPYTIGVVSRKALVYGYWKFIDSVFDFWIDARCKLSTLQKPLMNHDYCLGSGPLSLSTSNWLSVLARAFSSASTSSLQVKLSIWNRSSLQRVDLSSVNPSEIDLILNGCLTNMSVCRVQKPDEPKKKKKKMKKNSNFESDSFLSIWSIPITLSKVSIENMILLLGCVLVEMNIIIVCNDMTVLCATSSCIHQLIKPLTWVGPLICPCPEALLGYLDSPVPIIAGVTSLPSSFKLTPSTCLLYPQSNVIKLHPADMKQISSLSPPFACDVTAKLKTNCDALCNMATIVNMTALYQSDPFEVLKSKPSLAVAAIVKQVLMIRTVVSRYINMLINTATYLGTDKCKVKPAPVKRRTSSSTSTFELRQLARQSSMHDDDDDDNDSKASSSIDLFTPIANAIQSRGGVAMDAVRMDREAILTMSIGKHGLEFINKFEESQMYSCYHHLKKNDGSTSSENRSQSISGSHMHKLSIDDDLNRYSEFELDSTRSSHAFFPSSRSSFRDSYVVTSSSAATSPAAAAVSTTIQLSSLVDLFTMALAGSVVDDLIPQRKVDWCNGRCDGELNTPYCTAICISSWEKKMKEAKSRKKTLTTSLPIGVNKKLVSRLYACKKRCLLRNKSAKLIQRFFLKCSTSCRTRREAHKKVKAVVMVQRQWRRWTNLKKVKNKKKDEKQVLTRSKVALSFSSAAATFITGHPPPSTSSSRLVKMKGFNLKVYNEVVNQPHLAKVPEQKDAIIDSNTSADVKPITNSLAALVFPIDAAVSSVGMMPIKFSDVDNDSDSSTVYPNEATYEPTRDDGSASSGTFTADNMSAWPNSMKLVWNGIQVTKFTSSGSCHQRWLRINPIARIITWKSDLEQVNEDESQKKPSRRSSTAWLSRLVKSDSSLASLPAPQKRDFNADDASDTSETTNKKSLNRTWWGGRKSEGDKGIHIDDICEVGRGVNSRHAQRAMEKKNVKQTNLVITISTTSRPLDFEMMNEGDLNAVLETIMILIPNAIVDSLETRSLS